MSTQPFSNDEVSKHSYRALIGWLNDQEGIQLLLGRNTLPTDDIAALQQIVSDCRDAVKSRPAFTVTNPIIDVGDDPMLKAIRERPEVNATFAGCTWFPAMINLKEVLAFQKMINTEGLNVRLAAAHTSKEQLFELCVPTSQPLPPTEALGDIDRKGYTLGTLNPNLRIVGSHISGAMINTVPDAPTMQVLAFTFFVNMGANYLVVVRYKDRYFLRDGYHRATGLLREHIDVVPCICIDAQNFEQDVVLGRPQDFLPHEVLYGAHPARLTDFWDEEVSRTVMRVATRKVVRIRGEEFYVQG